MTLTTDRLKEEKIEIEIEIWFHHLPNSQNTWKHVWTSLIFALRLVTNIVLHPEAVFLVTSMN